MNFGEEAYSSSPFLVYRASRPIDDELFVMPNGATIDGAVAAMVSCRMRIFERRSQTATAIFD